MIALSRTTIFAYDKSAEERVSSIRSYFIFIKNRLKMITLMRCLKNEILIIGKDYSRMVIITIIILCKSLSINYYIFFKFKSRVCNNN